MRYVVGIDEVGRGALAGPVVVAAAAVPRNPRLKIYNAGVGRLRDSKKLTAKQREKWFHYITRHPEIDYAVARVYPRSIERMNISRAANLAAERAFVKLTTNYQLLATSNVYLDGGLYVGNKNKIAHARTIVRGDEKYKVVKLASIMAKVSRDRMMMRLAKKYPHYGFEMHKGYGTKRHFAAIKKHGPSKAHRLTFLKNYYKIK